MANGTFFTSWQLWEEMTFVLAMGIVTVFAIGLIKLWAVNRHMRKLEELDAEKQARVVQMRKSGLSANGRFKLGSEIPFGVKALEEGVEVEGIWVARMASMASRPPDRKWSSKRKIRAPPASIVEMSELGSPSSRRARRDSRGSRRSSKVSRREIVGPSQQTREKLENLSLLEEERQSGDWAGKDDDRSTAEATDGELAQRATGQSGQKSTLGKIQRGLKRMTSSDTWREQARRPRQTGTRLEAKEFHEGARAKKPQRFYPTPDRSSVTTTTPLVAPQARSHATRQRVSSLLSAHGATQVEVPHAHAQSQGQAERSFSDRSFTARQGRDAAQPAPDGSSYSFVTGVKGPKEPPSPSQTRAQHTRTTREGGSVAQAQPYGVPRRSSSLPRNQHRRSSSEGRSSTDHIPSAAHGELSAAASAQRYPPNSSRSRPVVHTRTQSGTESHQRQRAASKTPSPTSGPGEIYANTAKRRVNANFEVLPAGTFDFEGDQQQRNAVPRGEPASSAASVRSSVGSQSSGGRNKLQKKRKSQG